MRRGKGSFLKARDENILGNFVLGERTKLLVQERGSEEKEVGGGSPDRRASGLPITLTNWSPGFLQEIIRAITLQVRGWSLCYLLLTLLRNTCEWIV